MRTKKMNLILSSIPYKPEEVKFTKLTGDEIDKIVEDLRKRIFRPGRDLKFYDYINIIGTPPRGPFDQSLEEKLTDLGKKYMVVFPRIHD